MRPRVFPAEDQGSGCRVPEGQERFNEAAGIPRGRPRHAGGLPGRVGHASMRPRVFPAEDNGKSYLAAQILLASMRPRVFPAEDRSRNTDTDSGSSSFK